MLISVVIPTRNEESSIGLVLKEIKDTFEKHNKTSSEKLEFEVLIVDRSEDKTPEIAKNFGATVINEPRKGYGRAYKTGLPKANGEIIVTLDGDFTYPATIIPELVKKIQNENIDFINCDRLTTLKKGVMSFKHRFGNRVLCMTTNFLFGMKIRDSQTGMWCFKKKIIESLNLETFSDGMPFSEEIKVKVFRKGFRFVEIPIDYRLRVGEAKIQSFRDGLKVLFFLFKLRFQKV